MTDQVLDLLTGEDYEDMDMRSRPATSTDASTTRSASSYDDEDKRKRLARSAKYGHQHRAHDDDPDEWEGAPPTFGGAPETPEQTDARLAKGTGYKAQFGVPRSAYQPPAGHQNNRVKARNAAQLTYPWHLPMLAHTSVPDASVPASFDWRTKAGAALLTPVLDQGECGCCWAFASGQSLADRMRIASLGGNTVVPVLSAEYIKDCGTAALGARYDQLLDLGTQGTTGTCSAGASLSMGCEFLANYGAVSSQALPFSSSTAQGQDVGKCFAPRSNDILYTAKPGSVAVLTEGPSGHAPASHLAMTSAQLSADVIAQNCLNMQKNIMLYGPLCVTFMCYKDLCTADFDSSSYVDGVYTPDLSSGEDGGHAVTIVGWGVGSAQQTPYWIVRNSWGTSWNSSMGGYYLHLRAKNAAQIESAAVSLEAGPLAGGGGRPVDGSDLMQSERRRQEDVANVGFWQGLGTYQRAGLVAAIVAGVVVVAAIIISLIVYKKDKGFGWMSRS